MTTLRIKDLQKTKKITTNLLSLNSIDEGWVSTPVDTPALEYSLVGEEPFLRGPLEKGADGMQGMVACGLNNGELGLLTMADVRDNGGLGCLTTTKK